MHIQSMIALDINSDKVGPDMSLEKLASDYSTFLSTLTAGKDASKINNTGLKCPYCHMKGHDLSSCNKKKADIAKGIINPKGGGCGRGQGCGGRGGRGGKGGQGCGKSNEPHEESKDCPDSKTQTNKNNDKGKNNGKKVSFANQAGALT